MFAVSTDRRDRDPQLNGPYPLGCQADGRSRPTAVPWTHSPEPILQERQAYRTNHTGWQVEGHGNNRMRESPTYGERERESKR